MSSSQRPHRGTGHGSSSSHSPRDSYPAAARAPKASTSSSGTGGGAGGALSAPHPLEMTSFIQTSFIPAVAPTPDELAAKDAAFVFLETFVHRVAPGATLKPFGSMVNGFALRNSDMDLCCFQSEAHPQKSAAELVELLGRLILAETSFQVKMLPRARIPIIKLTMPPTETFPYYMACDIGFENRLALENTRLLHTYAKVDPRLKVMVLFLKVWTKKRSINNPYRGTLSSYGYVLLVIHFLTHVKSPAVLPNLQRLPLVREYRLDELSIEGTDIYFFDDLDALPRFWQTSNHESVGELLIEFFRYFAQGFQYANHVIAIRSETGFINKETKGWFTDTEYDPEVIVRDLHKLCIEDPFQQDYNVARTVTRDGLYTIRGEFIRACRILTERTPKGVPQIIRELCEEREESLVPHPPESATRYLPSPRRRSAPSPRLDAQVPLPSVMSDFRAWVAMHGVNGAAGLGTGAYANGATNPAAALDEAWEQLSPSQAYAPLYPHPHHPPNPYHPHQANHHPHHTQSQHPPHRRHNDSRRAHLSSSASNSSRSRPTSPPPSIERRVSWDGSGSASTTPQGGGYDLHRFFQAQPGDDPPRSAFTAPSSPDLGSTLHYVPYRYAPGPRLAGSLPPRLARGGAIFPEQDREALAIANAITFGNFPPPFPLPYPYATASSASSLYASTDRTSPTPSSSDDSERGRGVNGLVPTPGGDRAGRQRGRSVPHVRVDSEGRESILFGEIATVLPRAPVEPLVDSPLPTSPLPTSPLNGSSETLDLMDDDPMPVLGVPVPTFTTSPPTPQKLGPSPPTVSAGSPLVPMTISTALANPKRMSSPPAAAPFALAPERLANGIAHLHLSDESERKGG